MASLIAKGFYRLYSIRNRSFDKRLREIEQKQWWSHELLMASSWNKVQSLIRFAEKHVPYYRDVFKTLDATAEDFRSPETFLQFPILTKNEIQNNITKFIPDNLSKNDLFENFTGGSTGHMLKFYQDETYRNFTSADKFLTYKICGFVPGDAYAILTGHHRHTLASRRGEFKQRLLHNRMWINTFDLDKKRLGVWVHELQKLQPQMLTGYTSSLTMLAQYIEENGLDGISPKAVQTTTETLHPDQRNFLESVFNCKVYNKYGCREVGNIAQECEASNGLHILSESQFVEIINDSRHAKPGETGNIVITNLTNRSFPFIRYDIGDVGVASNETTKCPCGRRLPIISHLKGRASDIISTPEGKLVHGEFFTDLFYGVSTVIQFQVEQIEIDKLIIRIVKGPGFTKIVLDKLLSSLHKKCSSSMTITVEFPGEIEPTPSGKYLYTISRVPVSFI